MPVDIERQRELLKDKQAELNEAQESLELISNITDTALQLFEGRYPNQRVEPSVALDGSPRLLAYTMDEDAYSGYVERQSIHGATLVDDSQLLVERYFPSMKEERKVHITCVNLVTGEVSAHRESSEDFDQLPLEGTTQVQGREKTIELRDVLALLRSYGSRDTFGIKEAKSLLLIGGSQAYKFRIEQLQ